ncbi:MULTISPECIES: MFS transporter [Pelosinus]|uniref:Major facilitator superfamily MFS_1 n=1 Tax=Pelosinus fermentans B4 TaxID=1149862 RepID=I9LE49_9FIRM|nr:MULTISPECIES: MFS transporter [Pelosinus]EIW18739.1 major facilitator superfamily MFS_1 [Pelosinus fermentans B4]EIW22051.1 major facilitator superfamily MFS_1 [Pelosinus fermentans A11]OAM95096.1 major facilitator superfamily MFS_1 [Pelosinus fermentans DSM 17108]SDR23257.1 Predicted arabinose efflux permease, MFS family [Pelosinus fermentans]
MFRDKTLLGLISAVFLMMVGVGMIVALLPQRIIDLDGNGQSVGFLASTFAISYIVLQVPIGTLSDKLGFKPFLILGYLLCFITGFFFYISSSSIMIFLSRFLQGAGEAPIWALAPALLSLKFPLAKGKVMGMYNAVIHLGLTIGPILGVLLAKVWKANEVFLVYAILCLLGAVIIYLFVDSANKRDIKLNKSVDFNNIFKLISDRQALLALVGITLYGAGYGIFLTSIPTFLLQDKGFSSVYIGIFFSLFYVAISISQVVTGSLSDKFGPNLFMIIGLILAAVGIFSVPLLDSSWILIMLTFASLGLGIFYLASMAFLNETVAESLKGTISGAYYLFWGIGMFFGPPVLTMIAQYITFKLALVAYAVILIITASGMAIIMNSKRSVPNRAYVKE